MIVARISYSWYLMVRISGLSDRIGYRLNLLVRSLIHTNSMIVRCHIFSDLLRREMLFGSLDIHVTKSQCYLYERKSEAHDTRSLDLGR